MGIATFPAFKQITIGATTVVANETGSTLTFVEGSNITLALDPSTDTITISSPSGGGGGSLGLTPDNSSNSTNYVIFNNSSTGNLLPRTDTDFYYNPATGAIRTITLTVGAVNSSADVRFDDRTLVTNQPWRLDGSIKFRAPISYEYTT